MFRAIGRWFRSIGYFVTGRVDSSRRKIDTDPQAMRAKYDDVIKEKTKRIHEYKEAVAGLIAQQEKKLGTIKQLSEDIKRLEDLKTGALVKAQRRVAELQATGADQATVQADEDYRTCQAAFNDFSSTLSEKNGRVGELEGEVQEYDQRIKEHKLQLQELLREIEQLRSERHDAVAEVISAQQEAELNEAVAGIGTDKTSEKLRELRDLRQEVKAGARVAKELSGAESKTKEAEFLEYARKHAVDSEFDRLAGLAGSADSAAKEVSSEADDATRDRGQLPE